MAWASGQRLQGDKYVIKEILGICGFGITYKALHVPLNQHEQEIVHLKINGKWGFIRNPLK